MKRIAILIGLISPMLMTGCSNGIWFDNVGFRQEISIEDAQILFDYIREKFGEVSTNDGKMPESFYKLKQPTIVFLSFSGGKRKARVYIGEGMDLKSAVDNAVSNIQSEISNRIPQRWLKLDIVASRGPAYPIDRNLTLPTENFRPGHHGLALDRNMKVALLPEEVNGSSMLYSTNTIMITNLKKYLIRTYKEERSNITTNFALKRGSLIPFTVHSYFDDGETTYKLYRGHPVYSLLDSSQLQNTAEDIGFFLARSLDDKGNAAYSFNVSSGKAKPGVNLVRQGGIVFAMMSLYAVTTNSDLLTASEKAIANLNSAFVPYMKRSDALCSVSGHYVKLGSGAMALLALCKYTAATGNKTYLPTMQKLANYIVAEMRDDGSFICKRGYPLFDETQFVSLFYPSQSIDALMSLYEIDGNQKWFKAAEKAASYVIEVRDVNKTWMELYHDNWLIAGLDKLYKVNKNAVYLRYTADIMKSILVAQTKMAEDKDLIGGYFHLPSSLSAAMRARALISGYELLVKNTNVIESRDIVSALMMSSAFILQCVVTPPVAMSGSDPRAVLGGVRENLMSDELRIDYAIYVITFLVEFSDIIEQEKLNISDTTLPVYQTWKDTWKDISILRKE